MVKETNVHPPGALPESLGGRPEPESVQDTLSFEDEFGTPLNVLWTYPEGYKMTEKAGQIPYVQFAIKGWTIEQMIENGYMEKIDEEN